MQLTRSGILAQNLSCTVDDLVRLPFSGRCVASYPGRLPRGLGTRLGDVIQGWFMYNVVSFPGLVWEVLGARQYHAYFYSLLKNYWFFIFYFSGSILAALDTFKKMWVSKREYDESGQRAIEQKTF